ncbi:MAG TPA: hypothetical protein ENK74_03350 [Nitratifractor sp.]|nr:hypothetical protein [Nitratifractor sp.]
MKFLLILAFATLFFAGCATQSQELKPTVSYVDGEEVSSVSVVLTQEMIDEYKRSHPATSKK